MLNKAAVSCWPMGVKFGFVQNVGNDTWRSSKTTRSKNQIDRMSQRRVISFCDLCGS
jgi:hypothetical protein